MQDVTEVNGNTGFITGLSPHPQKLTGPKLQPIVSLLFNPPI